MQQNGRLGKSFMGLIFSFLVHALLILLTWIGIPQFLMNKKTPPPEAPSISVELLPVMSRLNLPPRPEHHTPRPSKELPQAIDKPKMPPPPPAFVAKEEIVKPEEKPVEKEALPPTEPPKPDIQVKDVVEEIIPQPVLKNKEPKKKEEKQKEKEILPVPKAKPVLSEEKIEEPKPSKKPIKVNDELEALLKNVEKFEEEAEAPKGDKTKGGEVSPKSKGPLPPHNPTLPLSLSEQAYIKRKIEKNWTRTGARLIAVKVDILLARDGSVINMEFIESPLYKKDPLYQISENRAREAVLKSSPFSELSIESYDEWKRFPFNFNPDK